MFLDSLGMNNERTLPDSVVYFSPLGLKELDGRPYFPGRCPSLFHFAPSGHSNGKLSFILKLSKNIANKVIPTKAGIHNLLFFMDARFRGHD